mmetsp:Transcript_56305/g.121318  ORF Transcript_56305/g.121318 Transcript_56305/m.121318 type:complete len:267 (-) Transcript_56305:967-1767(-)
MLRCILHHHNLLESRWVHQVFDRFPERLDFQRRPEQVSLAKPFRVMVLEGGDDLAHGLQQRPIVVRVPRKIYQKRELSVGSSDLGLGLIGIRATRVLHQSLALLKASDGALHTVNRVSDNVLVGASVPVVQFGVHDWSSTLVVATDIQLASGVLPYDGLIHCSILSQLGKAEVLAPLCRGPDPRLRLLRIPRLGLEVPDHCASIVKEAVAVLLGTRVLHNGFGQLPGDGTLLPLQRKHSRIAQHHPIERGVPRCQTGTGESLLRKC